MKKLTIFVFSFLLVFLCGCSTGTTPSTSTPSSVPDPTHYGARLVKYYECNTGTDVLKEYTIHHFNESGDIIRGDHYLADGTLSWYDVYGYDSLRQTRYTHYNSSGDINKCDVNEYYTDGTRAKMSHYSGTGNLTGYTVYECSSSFNAGFTYNSSNELALCYISDAASNGVSSFLIYDTWLDSQELTFRIMDRASGYTYDSSGILQSYSISAYARNGVQKSSSYYGNGDSLGSSTVEFDGQGRVLRSTIYNFSGATIDYIIWDYDDGGWLLKYSFYDSNDKLMGYYQNYY